MEEIPLEQDLSAMGVEVARPHALIAAPLVALAHTRSQVAADEERRILLFADAHLALDESQKQSVKNWLDAAPSRQFVEDSVRLLVLLRDRATSVGFENSVYRHVLSEGQKIVNDREEGQVKDWGQELLEFLTMSLQIDLGVPWDRVAPETLQSESERQSQKDIERASRPPIRRKLMSQRLERGDQEQGGII